MLGFHTHNIAQYLEWCIASRGFVYNDAVYFHSLQKKLVIVWRLLEIVAWQLQEYNILLGLSADNLLAIVIDR